jgi:Tfp pilus assembly protein FimV
MISRKEERAMYEAETARLIEHCGRSSVRAEQAEDRAEAAEAEATKMFANFKKMTAERDELQARVVKLRVALSIRNAEVDALQERVAELDGLQWRWLAVIEAAKTKEEPKALWGSRLESVYAETRAALEKDRSELEQAPRYLATELEKTND